MKNKTNKDSDYEYKSLSHLREELDELAAKYGSSGDIFYEIYTESLDRGPDYILNRIGSTNSAFDEAEDTDKEDVMKLLKAIHTAKAQQKGGVGARKGNKQPEMYVDIAHDLLADYSFKTMRDTEEVLFYNNGLYKSNGEALIKEEARKRLGDEFSTHQINEILNFIRYSTFTERSEFNENKHILNLKNGLYDLDTGKLSEHTPDFLTTIRIPINYDPEATCPKIDTFFSEVLKSEDIPILEEAFGYSLYPEYFIHKGFLLVGPGRNGKSTLLNLLEAFVGKDNVTNVLIHTLEFNRFAAAQLYNKLVLKNADLPDRTLKSTGMLKAIIGNDTIPAEQKFKGGFDFKNHAKLFISTNSVPVTYDTTVAFFSRWIILNFPNQFFSDESEEDEVKKAKTKILHTLTTEDELSGLLNKGLQGLKRLLENEDFSYNKRAEEVAEEYLTLSDPIYGFISECCVLDSVGTISKDELYINYVDYCKAKNRIAATKNKFGRILPTIVTIIDYTPKSGDKRVRAWKGLRILKTVTDVTDVTLNSNLKGCEENTTISSKDKVEKNTLPSLPSLPQVKQLSSMEKGICELCGKERWLSHELRDGAQKCLICTKCAEELKHKEDEAPKVPAGISLGDSIEYVKIGEGVAEYDRNPSNAK